jgi:hypothetical protein
MFLAHMPPLAQSLFSLLAITSLLLSFVMLGSRWLKNYLYAFAAQSWSIAFLSATVAYFAGYPELYLIAGVTALFRGLVLPYLIWRIIRRLVVNREIHEILQPASTLRHRCPFCRLRAIRLLSPVCFISAWHDDGASGADSDAVDDVDRLPDPRQPSRGGHPDPRAAAP